MKTQKKIKETILKSLKKRKGMTRKELASICNCSDRTMRTAIAELRFEGHMIGVTPQGGYTLNNEDDFVRAMNIYKARVSREQKTLRRMQKALESVNQVRYQP